MNHLIIYAHPNPNSLSHAYLEVMKEQTRANGHDVMVRDLYQMHFKPVDYAADFEKSRKGEYPEAVLTEQEYLRKADLISLIYPVWWGSMPAIMKGYFDRVFTRGFAFDYHPEKGLLKLLEGKKALVVNNMGDSRKHADVSGMTDSIKNFIRSGVFGFCGIETVEHLLFGNATTRDKMVRIGYIEEVRKSVSRHLPVEASV